MELPNAKVSSVGVTGALLTLLTFAVESAGWVIPDTAIAAVVTLIVFGVGYLVPLDETGKHAK